MPQGHSSALWRIPKSSVMTLRMGILAAMGVSRFTSPGVPSGAGSKVSGSRMITRLYTGTWKWWLRQVVYRIGCSTAPKNSTQFSSGIPSTSQARR